MMDDFYRENILDHYRHPRNVGTLENATHSHEDNNPLCGDVVRLDLHLNAEDVIDEVAFSGRGCAISQASASMLTEMVKGKTLTEARQIASDWCFYATLAFLAGPLKITVNLLSPRELFYGNQSLCYLTRCSGWPECST